MLNAEIKSLWYFRAFCSVDVINNIQSVTGKYPIYFVSKNNLKIDVSPVTAKVFPCLTFALKSS